MLQGNVYMIITTLKENFTRYKLSIGIRTIRIHLEFRIVTGSDIRTHQCGNQDNFGTKKSLRR